jgi:methylphosphotriester-DNA--protein-cysteine methyltransferase
MSRPAAVAAGAARAGDRPGCPRSSLVEQDRHAHRPRRAAQPALGTAGNGAEQATGVTHSMVRQIERARYAALLLRGGVSIPAAAHEAGYFDQPHLTRSMKQLIGQTPAELLDEDRPDQLSFLYKTQPFAVP